MLAHKITMIVVVAAVLAAGCATTRYEKAAVSEEQFKRDQAECMHEGFGGASLQPYPSIDRDAVDRCMAARGYTVLR